MSARPRVLIVDDSETFRAWTKPMGQREGWDLVHAATGSEALDVARQSAPDVLVLDFVLPDADGVELLRALRDGGVAAPCVVVSAADNADVAMRFLRAGAFDFIPKEDLTPWRLIHAIRQALRLAEVSLAGEARRDARRPDAAPDEDEEPPVDGAGRLALVVDDTATSRAQLKALLEAHGWRVMEAADAASALRAAGDGPDVVFLDHLLPDESGLDVLARLRAQRFAAPVIVLTGHGDTDLAERYLRGGAVDFLPKETVSGARLLATVTRAIRLGNAEVAVRELDPRKA